MIRGKFIRSTDDCSEIYALRRRVFVDEQGLSEDMVRDELDAMAIYALVFDERDAPSGTGRLVIDEDRFMLGRVCVLKEARGQGLGDLVLRMLLLRTQEMQAPGVYVEAQPPVEAFYRRYGFKPLGEAYQRHGAPHRLMRALAQEIDIEGNCGKQDGCRGCGACSEKL